MCLGCFSASSLSAVSDAGFDLDLTAATADLPIGGRTRACAEAWATVSKSKWVLGVAAEGYKIDWEGALPDTPHCGRNPPTDEQGEAILDEEVQAMLIKNAIEEVEPSKHEVVSGYFARPKKTPGKFRPIVSLKYTNRFIRKHKFRMTTAKDIKRWIRPGFFMASIDLTDAYFSLGLHKSGRRFCRFRWRGRTYEYKVVMFGLGPSARVFTKMLKAVLAFVRDTFGVIIVAYLDDLLVQAGDEVTCRQHTELVILVLQSLGYGVNFAKSALTPSRTVDHLGLCWDSEAMTVALPKDKVDKIVARADQILAANGCTADSLRSLLGTLESTRIVTSLAPLHYRSLQQVMPRGARGQEFPGARFLVLDAAAREDLRWWSTSFNSMGNTVTPLRSPAATRMFKTDASGLVGWGGHSSEGRYAQGIWDGAQAKWHINRKEIAGARLTLEELMEDGERISIGIDSTTAVAYINKMGGTRSRALCREALSLWGLVLSRRGWVSAYWVPREENERADMLSKTAVELWDFGLRPEVAAELWSRWYTPEVDLFGSCTFHQVDTYYSWFPDTKAAGRDAFTLLKWQGRAYAFPPVPLISLSLEKLERDQATAILVAPLWRSASWWDTARALMVGDPWVLGLASEVLQPREGQELPRLGTMMACMVSGAPHRGGSS